MDKLKNALSAHIRNCQVRTQIYCDKTYINWWTKTVLDKLTFSDRTQLFSDVVGMVWSRQRVTPSSA